ncbi:hypothetical protein PLO_0378 [Pediococcus acidilactici NGRI 0510Q]|nr:hypothetical protein PLO_0378 [Pediococcus acidilactici NGRI 0510Q]
MVFGYFQRFVSPVLANHGSAQYSARVDGPAESALREKGGKTRW